MTRSILCYGDSNTYGAAVVERPDGRYSYDERWTGVLAASLGLDWMVVEAGLNGRTTVHDDPVEGDIRNGRRHILPCILSHFPLDLVAIMLGTNDLKARFGSTAWDIAEGVGTLVELVRSARAGRGGGAPEILVIAPPPFRKVLPSHAAMFVGAYEKSLEFAERYRAMAAARGAHFLDAGAIVESSQVDGFHLDPEAHGMLGLAVANAVRSIAA